MDVKAAVSPTPIGFREGQKLVNSFALNTKIFSSTTIDDVINIGGGPILVEVRDFPFDFTPRECPVPFPTEIPKAVSEVGPGWKFDQIIVSLRGYSQNKDGTEQFTELRFSDIGIGSQCLLFGAKSVRGGFKIIAEDRPSDYLHILYVRIMS